MAIVYGTDFSEQSEEGALGAAAFARQLKQPLVLVHAIDPGFQLVAATYGHPLDATVEARLRELSERVRRTFPKLEVRHRVAHGSAHEALAAAAEEEHAVLLVVSSQGHGASPLHRLGGTSERVVLEAKTPALVMRSPQAFVAWAEGGPPLKVVLGVDDTDATSGAIDFVRRLRSGGPCDVTAAHVYYLPEARAKYGVGPRGLWSEVPDARLEALLARDVRERVGELPGAGALEVDLCAGLGRPSDHLLAMAERKRAQLLVVGSHQARGLTRLSSVSQGALHFGRMAVACIPAGAAPSASVVPPVRLLMAGVDFSAPSRRAVAQAAALAGDGRTLLLVHVAPPEGGPSDAELAGRLRELVPGTGAGVLVRTEVVRDRDPARALATAAERFGADVLVVGSRGGSPLVRAALGSVAEALLRKSRRPVVVVPASEP